MKRFFVFTLLVLLLFISVKPTFASLIVIKSDGNIIWNVLAEESTVSLTEPRNSYIEVKRVGEEEKDGSSVTLAKEDGKISLVVSSGNETRELNVSGVKEDLIEVEERPEVEKLSIGIGDGRFKLSQRNIEAYTSYPIHIDAKRGALSLTTSKGDEFLSILPYEAVEAALRTKILTKVSKQRIEIADVEGQLRYKMDGEKIFNFFDIFEYKIPITAYVSPVNGEIVSIDSPTWFKYVRFLFL